MIYLSWLFFHKLESITGEVKIKKISPDRIVDAIKENFKGILSKPLLKNLILVTIAMSKKLKINEIARQLPVEVSHQKVKQTRLLRYLKKPFPLLDMMFTWSNYVLNKTHGSNEDAIIVLINGVDSPNAQLFYRNGITWSYL